MKNFISKYTASAMQVYTMSLFTLSCKNHIEHKLVGDISANQGSCTAEQASPPSLYSWPTENHFCRWWAPTSNFNWGFLLWSYSYPSMTARFHLCYLKKNKKKKPTSSYVLVRYQSAEFLLIGILESKDLIRVPWKGGCHIRRIREKA